ncbi:MAG TPA: zinc ribbon domain-containing protein [Burkholderiales bacterium]|jgi:putative FmdB family regulatory protein
MPIYEYKCSACGHQEDHLQKLSERPLTKCPACGKKKYAKQLTAAGFQLKGSGWYASDFKGGGKKAETEKPEAKTEAKAETKTATKTETKSETKSETKTEAKPEKKTPASTTN